MVDGGGQSLVELGDEAREEESAVGEARAYDGDQRFDAGPVCKRHEVDGRVCRGARAPEADAAYNSDDGESECILSTWYIDISWLGCQALRKTGNDLRKSHPEHKGDAELLGPRELKLEGLVDWKTDYHDVHGQVDDAVAEDEFVDVKTVAGLLGRPSGPGEVDRLALKDDDEDEKDHDEDVEPDDRVRDAAEDRRCVKDA